MNRLAAAVGIIASATVFSFAVPLFAQQPAPATSQAATTVDAETQNEGIPVTSPLVRQQCGSCHAIDQGPLTVRRKAMKARAHLLVTVPLYVKWDQPEVGR